MSALPNSPAAAARHDFPDWLSPMLVKELRQGMRTKVFVLSFILLQILMTLNVVIGLLSTANGLSSSGTSIVFWLMVGFPLLIILPLGGLGALSSEKAANTLELILLTRLSAWRIVLGKWFAIVAQTSLFVCTVLPYVVLRYFMGGVNLADDLIGLGLMLAGSAVLTGITVGVSPFPVALVRVLSTIAIFIIILFGGGGLMAFLFQGQVVSGGGGGAWAPVATILVFGGMLIFLMLQIAAGKIAPPAENHSAVKRLIGIGFFLGALILVGAGANPPVTIFVAMACSAPVLIGSICEVVRTNAGVYQPFLQRGAVGRLLGRFFYPGWPAGLLYAVVLLGAFGVLMAFHGMLANDLGQLGFVGVVGALLFPAAVVRLCLPRTPAPLVAFVGVAAVCTVLTILASILDSIFETEWRIFLCALPPAAFIQSLFAVIDTDAEAAKGLPLAAVGTLLSAVVLLVRVVPEWMRIRALERTIPRDEPVA